MKNLSILLLVALAGCAASGPLYSENDAKIKNKLTSKIIFYRPSTVVFSGIAARITVDGKESCDLHSGGFFALDVEPGKHAIKAINPQPFLGSLISDITITTTKGNASFLRFSPAQDKVIFYTTGGGLIGGIASSVAPDNQGFFLIEEKNLKAAGPELKTLKSDCSPI